MFVSLETVLLTLVDKLPLELFVFLFSFIEEVIAPVPSAAVLLLTGSIAALQERPLLALIPLAFIAALGKTLGAIVVYHLASKIGHVVVEKYGRFFSLSPATLTALGNKITNTPKDYLLLTIFRALPIIPSSVMSVGCGLLKIRFRLFIITTLIGTIIRDSIFIYMGYSGIQILNSVVTHSAGIESVAQFLILISIATGLGYLYIRRRKNNKVSTDPL